MQYYPIFLDIKGKDCLVIGGGSVGARKAAVLEKCGANVTIVSERFSSSCDRLKTTCVCFEKRKYEKEDVKGKFLVFAATDNAELNRQIKEDAALLNIFCNVVDAPMDSDFIVPATLERGDLIVAVSTSGSSPAAAKKIKRDLESYFSPAYTRLLVLMGNIRKKLLAGGHSPGDHKQIFNCLIQNDILDLIEANDEEKINIILYDLLGDVLGGGYTYRDLAFFKE